MHTRHEGIVRTWKCRFTRQGNYVVVFEWDTHEHMRAALDKAKYKDFGYFDNAHAAAHSFGCAISQPHGGRVNRKFPKKYGEVHFVKDTYGVGIVSHEMQHIVNYYRHSKGWGEFDDEKIATIMGNLMNKFYLGFYKDA